jgi:D-methionine transport system permease protein
MNDATWLDNPVIREGLVPATVETLYMTGVAGLLTILVGLPLGVLLQTSGPQGLHPRPAVHRVLGLVVNVGRSLPFLILMIAIIPFTRFVAGTSLGATAAVVPLTVGAIPFFARLVENAVREVETGKVEAALMMGATNRQVVRSVLVPEALPGVLGGSTVTLVTLLSYTAMAGAVGGGGLGALAINYGYQRFQGDVMVVTVAVLLVLVQLIQLAGDRLVRHVDHR